MAQTLKSLKEHIRGVVENPECSAEDLLRLIMDVREDVDYLFAYERAEKYLVFDDEDPRPLLDAPCWIMESSSHEYDWDYSEFDHKFHPEEYKVVPVEWEDAKLAI